MSEEEALWENFDKAKAALLSALKQPTALPDPVQLKAQSTTDELTRLKATEQRLIRAENELRECRRPVASRWGVLLMMTSPIAKIPAEILHNIFTHIPTRDHKTVMAVTAVSTYWRTVSTKCRCLWAQPNWHSASEQLLWRWIERSGDSPLKIKIDSARMGWDNRGRSERFCSIEPILKYTSDRWTSLSLVCREEDSLGLFQLMQTVNNTFGDSNNIITGSIPLVLPRLETLHFQFRGQEFYRLFITVPKLPSLRSLHLSHAFIRDIHLFAPALAEVRLVNIVVPRNEWINMLSSCQFLKSLVCQRIQIDPREAGQPSVIAATLEHLTIQNPLDIYFSGITLPQLSHITLIDTEHFAQFVSMIQ